MLLGLQIRVFFDVGVLVMVMPSPGSCVFGFVNCHVFLRGSICTLIHCSC